MATTRADTTGLMRKRSLALASVYLTRRPGAIVQDCDPDTGVDLVLTLPLADRRGLRQLGVMLRYALDPAPRGDADAAVRRTWPVPGYGPFPFPVVLFYFTMRDNGEWFGWVAEPVVSAGGTADLPLRAEPACAPLTDKALEEVIDRVDAWYDAYYDLPAPAPAKRRAKKS